MGLGATNMHFFFFSFCDSDINWIITNQIGACNHLGTWCALLCIHLFTRPYNIHAAQTANSAGVKKILFRSYNLLRKIQASKRLCRTKLFLWLQPLFIIDWKYAIEKNFINGGMKQLTRVLIPSILSWQITAQTTFKLLNNRSQKAETIFQW